MSQAIRIKPKWNIKVNDPTIVKKWMVEAEEQGLPLEAINYVIEKIKYLAAIFKDGIEPGPIDAVWQADGLIDKNLKLIFKDLVKSHLELLPKDFHPGSNDLVVDLVHPSLYCYVKSHSKIVNYDLIDDKFKPDFDQNKPNIKKNDRYILPSGFYRWLPSEVTVSKGGEAKFETYINNLNPTKNLELYSVIAEIFSKSIPLFNKALTDTLNYKDVVIDINICDFIWYYEEDNFEENCNYSDEDERFAYIDSVRSKPLPIPEFKIPEISEIIDLKGENLQVIVKLANIELTPDNPSYSGGSWHIEGIEEERIVATGIYYYDIENITESKLNFRIGTKHPNFLQNDTYGVYKIYGLKDGEILNQILGGVNTIQDRFLVFPNFYQHCVSPFELIDHSKPGHRKILAFFLVDPSVKIISTKNVLPQQLEWTEFNIYNDRGVMTRSEAEEYRKQLISERKVFTSQSNEFFFEAQFYLCEH